MQTSKIIVCWVSVVISHLESFDQRLNVNSAVPDVTFNQILNYNSNEKNLFAFKGKFVILDFWNRFCSNCISAFPKMEYLQNRFKDNLQILLVTTDPYDNLNVLFLRSPILRNIRLPIVFKDSVLSNVLFPHVSVPFYVWLDPSGRVKAMTDAYDVNEKNVTDFIHAKPLKVSQRFDILDQELERELTREPFIGSILKAGNGQFISNLRYYRSNPADANSYSLFLESSSAGSIRGLLLPFTPHEVVDLPSGYVSWRYFNKDVITLFKLAYHSFADPKVKKTIIEDDVGIEKEPARENGLYEEWFWRNCFTYECKGPNYSLDDADSVLREDLKRFFGAIAVVEQREMNCSILYRTTNKNKLAYKKGESVENIVEQTGSEYIFKNASFNLLISKLEQANSTANDKIIIDETGFPPNTLINMSLHSASLKDTELLRGELNKYGLGLKEEKKIVKVLVLKNACK